MEISGEEDVYRFAYAYMGSGADAEDIVQEVFLKFIQKKINIFAGKEKSYLMTMTANACKDVLKSGNMRSKAVFEDFCNIAANNVFFEDESGLFIGMRQLDEKYRSVLFLYYFEGYTMKEISKILRISPSAVSMRLTRGKRELKQIFEKEDLV